VKVWKANQTFTGEASLGTLQRKDRLTAKLVSEVSYEALSWTQVMYIIQ
jgi:hypothetical protein